MSSPVGWGYDRTGTLSRLLLMAALAGCGADNKVGGLDPGTPGGASGGSTPGGGAAGNTGGGPGGTGVLGGGFGSTGGSVVIGPGTLAGGSGGAGGSGAIGGTMPEEPITLDDCGANNPAKLSDAQVKLLKAGGPSSARILYPYDGTVFPRGLGAPLIMWDGGGAVQSVYVHLKSSLFEYHGCLVPSGDGQLQLPQQVWDMAGGKARGARDPFTFELTTLSGQQAAGPITQKFVIAQANLKGSVYYNSYNSQLTGGLGQDGAILRLRPGRTAELFLRQGACTGCHSLSANGQRMVAKEVPVAGLGGVAGGLGGLLGGIAGGLPGGGGIPGGGLPDGEIYSLMENTPPNPAPTRTGSGTAFTGLTPTGQYYLASAGTIGLGPRLEGASQGLQDSVLYETDTGNTVANTGIPTSAMMPSFSADGTRLVYADLATNGSSLAVMEFDPNTAKAQNVRAVYSNNQYLPGWPFVLPDNRAVVFALGQANDYSGLGAGIDSDFLDGPLSELMIVDLESGKSTILARAMGYQNAADAQAGKTYLPFGQEELHRTYYPTVSPVAGGGYFWIFFDSIRHYGNQGIHRQLWGAAIAVQAAASELATGGYGEDPSYPAFYLPGQELPVANHRAFTALDPCRADGASCESGVDCCNGFCTNGICGVEAPRCAQTNEACKVDKDCCNYPDEFCIGGFCGPSVLR
jgi:hypothetical protein